MDYNEEVQYQSQPGMFNQKSIQQCNQCSLPEWIYWIYFIQRTEQVPIELDISAIEEYILLLLL